ncbi:MAG: GAF domain-containing protein [Acidobacteria bacterium]|nr:GAF domain-containing protein [Acidobacteriota bacterium]
MRGEEVAGSIDANVREAIERMVGEIRSSIDDVRVAVDQQLKAALQSVQADVNAITFLPQIQKAIGELEENYAAEKPEPVAAAPSGGGNTSLVRHAIQAVERGKSQVEILNALLEQCLSFGSRAALLILRGGETFSGWKGVGFSAHGGNDEAVKRFNATPGLISELDALRTEERVIHWNGQNLATRLGVGAPQRAILVPMVIKDTIAAAVYVDATDADVAKLDASAVELLVFTTGLLIDTVAMRKKIPSPTLNDVGAVPANASPDATIAVSSPITPRPAAPAPPPAAAPAPAAPSSTQRIGALTSAGNVPTPKVPTPPAAPAPSRAQGPESTVAISADQIRAMMASPSPSFNMTTAEELSAPSPRPTPAPAPPPPPPPAPVAPPPPPSAPAAPPAASALEEGGRPSTQYIPPANINRNAAPSGAQGEDTKKHDEARRFARLLVSEIKLYNEAKVEQGRKNKDLYERLKEDIDRSRQMYDERISEDVRKVSNYFYDELVRILADGNSESLGL